MSVGFGVIEAAAVYTVLERKDELVAAIAAKKVKTQNCVRWPSGLGGQHCWVLGVGDPNDSSDT